MTFRLQQSLSEQRFSTRNAPLECRQNYPPFSFDTSAVTRSETDCVSASRRRRVTTILCGVRYYGYRYYNPDLGRWINRDPIGERGGAHLYLFARNSAVDEIDFLGMINVPTPSPWPGGSSGGSPGHPEWLDEMNNELIKAMPYPLEDIEWQGGPRLSPDPASIKCGECEELVEIESLETKRYRERRYGLILKWFGRRWILREWSIHSVYECLSFEDARWYSDDPLRIKEWDWESSKQRVEYRLLFYQ